MSKPSVQLYSVRDAIDDDLDRAVARVAEIGFTRVEPYAFHLRTADYRRAFDATGLTAPSGHAAVIDASDPSPIFDAAATSASGRSSTPSSRPSAGRAPTACGRPPIV